MHSTSVQTFREKPNVFSGSTIKAVLFDLDGVLVDAREWHYDALNQALALFGYTISRHEHLHDYDGLPTRTKLQMLTADKGLPVGLHAIINEMKQRFTLEKIFVQCRPVFQQQFMLASLRAHGLRIGVCSNSIRQTVDMVLSKMNTKRYFDVVLSNEDVSASKPHPEIYTKALQLFELEPGEVVAIEDNANGLASARAAGLHVLEVRDWTDVRYEAIETFVRELKP